MSATTSWTLYASNEEAWLTMLKDAKKAKESISLETFIFYNDEYGQKLLDILIERAAAGVKVRMLWDAAGSFSLFGSNIVQFLKEKGVELIFWKTLIPGYYQVPNFRSWYLRNHRRTVVIDNVIGYTGSICIKDEYKNWRDTNLRLEGPVVQSMQTAFERMWNKAQGRKDTSRRSTSRDAEFSYITNSPLPRQKHLYRSVIETIRNAEKYIYITNPYFVPTHRLLRVLKLAAHRGVDVRIILPEDSNIFAVDLAARSYFDTILQSGVRIFLYQGNVIHGKTMVVDGTWSTVGSLNLDVVSLLYNYEANVVSLNSKFAEELATIFVHDLQSSKEVSLEERKNRFFLEKIPELLIRLVRNFL